MADTYLKEYKEVRDKLLQKLAQKTDTYINPQNIQAILRWWKDIPEGYIKYEIVLTGLSLFVYINEETGEIQSVTKAPTLPPVPQPPDYTQST